MNNEDRAVQAAEKIYGWFTLQEMRLLYQTAIGAIRKFPALAIVEIGSFQGRSTVVLGVAVQDSRDPDVRVYAVDPHEGKLTTREVEPTFNAFLTNISSAGVGSFIIPIREKAENVPWSWPISLLFIDGLHTFEACSSDYEHFSSFVAPGGFIAFHDYDNKDFPGVKKFVDQKIESGELSVLSSRVVDPERTLIVTKKG